MEFDAPNHIRDGVESKGEYGEEASCSRGRVAAWPIAELSPIFLELSLCEIVEFFLLLGLLLALAFARERGLACVDFAVAVVGDVIDLTSGSGANSLFVGTGKP